LKSDEHLAVLVGVQQIALDVQGFDLFEHTGILGLWGSTRR
jgi:hypothetical protein